MFCLIAYNSIFKDFTAPSLEIADKDEEEDENEEEEEEQDVEKSYKLKREWTAT